MVTLREASLIIEMGKRLAQPDNEKGRNRKPSKITAVEVVYIASGSQETFKAGFTVSAINSQANQYESLFVMQDHNNTWYVDRPTRIDPNKSPLGSDEEIKHGPDLDLLIQQFNVKGLDFPNKADIDRLVAEDHKFALTPLDKEPLPTAMWSPPKMITEFKKEKGVTSARAISFGPSPS